MYNKINDSLTYVTGLGAGYAGINAIPAMANGQLLTALIGLITIILQALLMKVSKQQDNTKVDITKAMMDLQKQILEIKSGTNVDSNSRQN
jgi:hypothetical protein